MCSCIYHISNTPTNFTKKCALVYFLFLFHMFSSKLPVIWTLVGLEGHVYRMQPSLMDTSVCALLEGLVLHALKSVSELSTRRIKKYCLLSCLVYFFLQIVEKHV